jgi:hypothetical protein
MQMRSVSYCAHTCCCCWCGNYYKRSGMQLTNLCMRHKFHVLIVLNKVITINKRANRAASGSRTERAAF